MSLPLFFPAVRYVKSLVRTNATTLEDLCAKAGVDCKASGPWTQRLVMVHSAGERQPWVHAEPGDWNAVEIGAPVSKDEVALARWALGALAFMLFDGVARASIAGEPWARIERPRGRVPGPRRPRSVAERVRSTRRAAACAKVTQLDD